MKRLFILFLSVFCLSASYAQLQTGDIAFTGFNADGDDDVAFVALRDIPANTTIYFCDSEWNGSAFGDDENDITWESGSSTIAAGTIVQINHLDGEIAVNLGTVSGGTGLSKNGDALFAYVGTALREPTTFLAAISNLNAGFGDLSGTGLKAGFTAIVLTETADIATYTGPRSGIDKNGYFAQLNNMDNWEMQDTDSDTDHADGQGPEVPFSVDAFSFADQDVSAPYVLSVDMVSATQLRVFFSELLKEASATRASNFSLSPAIGITDIVYDADNNMATLTHEGVSEGIASFLTVEQLEDTSGNQMTTTYKSEAFILNTSKPNLLITEIMYAAPGESDDDLEFLEIYNAGDDQVQLGGIQLKDEGNFVFVFPEMALDAGATVLLATNKAVADDYYGATFIDMVASSGNMLGNGGELLQVLNSNDELIFEVEYDDKAPWAEAADGGGSSLELMDPEKPGNDASNWRASSTVLNETVFASPGVFKPYLQASVSFSEPYLVVDENAGSFAVDVVLTTQISTTVTVNVSVVESLTNAGAADYTFAEQVLTFTPGEAITQTLTIPVADNAVEEMDKMLVLSLTEPNGCTLGETPDFVGYILDDEETAPTAANELGMEYVGNYVVDAQGTAEIVAHDPTTQRLFVLNSERVKVEVIDFSDPANLQEINELDMSAYGSGATSVAVKNGVVAATVENGTGADGVLVLLDTDGNEITTLTVGNLPDMVTFTPDGNYILVANEGQPGDDYTVDPEGSISLIDVSGGATNVTQDDVVTIDFNDFDSKIDELKAAGVRIFGHNSTVSQDVEPEYITIAQDGTKAWVSLQENNAIGVIDLVNKSIENIIPLGTKDHMVAGNVLDVSDKIDDIVFSTYPIKGMYMPDAIASYSLGDTHYIVTANEGDQREYGIIDEDVSIGDDEYVLDPTVFPNAEIMKKEYVLGRLAVSPYSGDIDGDGDFDEIHAFGTRSFSIVNASTGAVVYDSGSDFEKITANDPVYGELFNASNSNNNFKNRSDNKGPEPEGIAVAEIKGKFYAFITLERTGGVMVYDITNPAAVVFENYINNRDLGDDEGGNLGPEGIIYIPANESPTEKGMVVVANEVSSTLSVYTLAKVGITPTAVSTANANALRIYPNPTASKLFFGAPTTFAIYNLHGTKVHSAKLQATADVSFLPSGQYVIVTHKGESAQVVVK